MKELLIEEKDLLLKDLCARLPYGVKIASSSGIGKVVDSITIRPDYIEIVIKGTYAYSHFIHKDTGKWDNHDDLDRCKPYLRPMSSMTEEEIEELDNLVDKELKDSEPYFVYEQLTVDFYLRHHLDNRLMIEKGLALEAPEGMYNIKEK